MTEGSDAGERGHSIRTLLRDAQRRLEEAGVAECLGDAQLMLAHAMGASPTWIFAHDDEPVPDAARDTFRVLLERRARREPLQHLLGTQQFWSLSIGVSPDVLIPRPETELLVEVVLAGVRGLQAPRVADVGTGSGCIALALAVELPLAHVVATDVSPAAIRQAHVNARALGLEDRIELREGSLVDPLRSDAPFDAVASNLPYVSRSEWQSLEPEVRDHDPELALVAGDRGTELIERLIEVVPDVLVPNGFLALEVGHAQADQVASSLTRRGWRDVATRRDLAGIERVVVGRRAG